MEEKMEMEIQSEVQSMAANSYSTVPIEIEIGTYSSKNFGTNDYPLDTLTRIPFWIADYWNNGQGYEATRLRYWFPKDMTQASIDRLQSIRDHVATWEESDEKADYLAIYDDIINRCYAFQDNTPPPLPPPPPPVDA